MKTKSKVSKFTGNRKIVEIPALDRDEYEVGDKVYIEKVKRKSRG